MYGSYYSSDPDLMEDMKDLHTEGLKKNVYILLSDGQIRAATTKTDIEKHLASDEAIVKFDGNADDTKLFYGLLMDPASLPYDIAPTYLANRKLYVLAESGRDVEIEEYDEIEEVTEAISDLMGINDDLEITDFAVLLGSELSLVLAPGKSGESIPVYQVLGEHS